MNQHENGTPRPTPAERRAHWRFNFAVYTALALSAGLCALAFGVAMVALNP